MARKRYALEISAAIFAAFIAASLPFAVELALQAPYARPATPLAALPSPAKEILAIEVGGFYDATIVVRTSDGQVLESTLLDGPQALWRPLSRVFRNDDALCTPITEWRLRAAIGRLTGCRQIQLIGEWCPGPIASFGIDTQGVIWQRYTYIPCYPLSGSLAVLIGAVILASGAWILLRRYRHHARNAPSG